MTRPVCLRLAHRQPPWLAAPAPALSPLLLIPGVAEPPVRLESSILLHSSPLLRSLASSCCCTTTILLPFTTGAALHCLGSLLATGATTTSPPLLVQLQELLAILQIDIQTERVPLAPRPPARAAGRPRSATVARIDLTKAPPAATGRKVAGTIDDEAAFRPPQRMARPPPSPSVPRSVTSARGRVKAGVQAGELLPHRTCPTCGKLCMSGAGLTTHIKWKHDGVQKRKQRNPVG